MNCINLDWFEVHCLETQPWDKMVAVLERYGYVVKYREYGTPQYEMMCTVSDRLGVPLLEVRRQPKDGTLLSGILHRESCHLKISNNVCYTENPLFFLEWYLDKLGVQFMNFTRIDIAFDFQKFKGGYAPGRFCKNFLNGKLAKLHSKRFSCHGSNEWNVLTLNSLKWGSPTSLVNTKLYNKSLELSEGEKMKPYIKEAWKAAGMDDTKLPVWRIEFSCTSDVKLLANMDTGEVEKLKPMRLGDRGYVMEVFAKLFTKYFDFRKIEFSRNGKMKSKYKCSRVSLFDFELSDNYTPRPMPIRRILGRTDKMLQRRLESYAADLSIPSHAREAASNMLVCFPSICYMGETQGYLHTADIPDIWSLENISESDMSAAKKRKIKDSWASYVKRTGKFIPNIRYIYLDPDTPMQIREYCYNVLQKWRKLQRNFGTVGPKPLCQS